MAKPRKHLNLAVIAAKRYGKTELVKKIIEKYIEANPNNGVVYFSVSGKPKNFPKKAMCFRGSFDEVAEIFEKCQNILVVFDDAKPYINATNVKVREALKTKLADSRHYGIEIVLCLQSLNQLPDNSEFLVGGIIDELWLGNTRAEYASVDKQCEQLGISETEYAETLNYEFPEESGKSPIFKKVKITTG